MAGFGEVLDSNSQSATDHNGDFNVVKSANEKSGGEARGLSSFETDFERCIYNIEVEYHPYVGCFYRWNNKCRGICG